MVVVKEEERNFLFAPDFDLGTGRASSKIVQLSDQHRGLQL
jgi:hypothetical protein